MIKALLVITLYITFIFVVPVIEAYVSLNHDIYLSGCIGKTYDWISVISSYHLASSVILFLFCMRKYYQNDLNIIEEVWFHLYYISIGNIVNLSILSIPVNIWGISIYYSSSCLYTLKEEYLNAWLMLSINVYGVLTVYGMLFLFILYNLVSRVSRIQEGVPDGIQEGV